MAQTRSGGPSESEPANGGNGGSGDSPELWGDGGLVGDGRYRLTHRLGRGGMAEVFAAEDVRLGRTVAVKLLRSDLAEDPVSKARFTREAQSVAGLNHHAVVAVYDSGEDVIGGSTVPYIVMELVEGRTIRDLLIESDAPPPDQALIIVSGVLEALAYSHHHGIVHRDIKPANVIITNTGAVKVMDFGIARALHGAQSTMTQTGMVMGTPQYLSPEQALGKTVDTRSDLYATGCLLYELLAHRPPFTGESPLSVVYQHVQDIPVPPSRVSDAVPPELDGLVMRSLAKDPDDRFQTAEEMRGLAQYALQMLTEHGGHTGAWDTGTVAMAGAAPAAGTTAMMPAGGGDTSQIPAPLLGPPRGDDGGFDGTRHDGGRGGSGRSRGTLLLVAALALIAVTVGIIFALDRGDDGREPDQKPTPTVSRSQDKETSESPEDEATQDTETDPGTGGQNEDYTPEQPSGEYTPSQDPTGGETPSTTPSQPPSSTPSQSTPSDPGSEPGDTGDPGGDTGGDPGGAGGDPGGGGGDVGAVDGGGAGD
ncbi:MULTISPECIES: protein kinase domain-containing protein [Streptomyces]|uniref:non-specific serine/threonine protein kinase n=2 Tax=Streptomyces TaxID=1883 RepID=A0A3R7EK84_9ACTN|nr:MULTISPECIES: protein kinase [Streptomyces]KNE79513.1 serine/threonine protein kinase [Streptomyces fradiae]OFA49792.1 serine/threonine protein kinase [Streptomyces fradiae]PQM23036.1 serine/threonine protein kinase [Streptomyces xinghaiensis]RKM91402.1 serine/threonine protein kinase [Streptomyces xinghaiensis]RNC74962.1 serine/threonine protein kinase [Streptomyces xinghaiensis]